MDDVRRDQCRAINCPCRGELVRGTPEHTVLIADANVAARATDQRYFRAEYERARAAWLSAEGRLRDAQARAQRLRADLQRRARFVSRYPPRGGTGVVTRATPTMTPEQLAEWERKVREGTLFSSSEPTRTRALIAALHERFPDGVLPFGEQAQLADEFDLVRGYVSAVARAAGFRSEQRKHRMLHLVCPECGQHFTFTPRQQIQARANAKYGSIKHPEQHMPTCSKPCAVRRGIRIGKEKRQAAHDEATSSAPR